MDESILVTIKKLLGITKDYTNFDTDIIMHINTTFNTLNQLGIGPSDGFIIEDDQATWNDYLFGNVKLNSVVTYIYLKVKLVFDPPLNSAILESMKQSIKELEWRLNIEAES